MEEDKFIIDTVIGSQLYYSVKDFYRQSAIIGRTKDTAAINEYLVKAFREHLQDPFSGFILSMFLKINANNPTEVARLYGWVQQQKKVIKTNLAVAGFFTAIENMMNKEPLNFDGFGFIDRNNRTTAIEFKGASFYVLDLWYTSCVPCVKQHLEIAANLEKLNAAGVALIGISTDTKYTVWKKYLEKHRYGWSNYMIDPRGKNWIDEKRYASFPGYIILSSDIKILAYFGHIDHVLEYFKVPK